MGVNMLDNTKSEKKKYTTRVDRVRRVSEKSNYEIELMENRLKELRKKKEENDRKVEAAEKRQKDWENRTGQSRENKFKYQLGGYFLNRLKGLNNKEAMLNDIYKTLQNNKEKKVFIDMCKKIYAVEIVDNSILPRGIAQANVNEIRTENDSARELSQSDIYEIEKIVMHLNEHKHFENESQKRLFNHLVDSLPNGLGDTYWEYCNYPA